jgi:hypothetical protein
MPDCAKQRDLGALVLRTPDRTTRCVHPKFRKNNVIGVPDVWGTRRLLIVTIFLFREFSAVKGPYEIQATWTYRHGGQRDRSRTLGNGKLD